MIGKDGKQFLFADWLEEMHRLVGFEAPPRGRILTAPGRRDPAGGRKYRHP